MRKVFIDSDVFLDTIIDRKPHSEFSNTLLTLCEQKEVDGYTSTLILANIYYVIRKITNAHKALEAIGKIRSIVKVLPLTDKEIGESIHAQFKDFKDGLQYFVAINHKIDCMITRNARDFKNARISILSPYEFLKTIKM